MRRTETETGLYKEEGIDRHKEEREMKRWTIVMKETSTITIISERKGRDRQTDILRRTKGEIVRKQNRHLDRQKEKYNINKEKGIK